MRDHDEQRPGPGDPAAPTATGAGEKACPYCAETIKAAAIRCRWCQADLADDRPAEPATGRDSDGEPAGAPAGRPAAGPTGGPGRDREGDHEGLASAQRTTPSRRPGGVLAGPRSAVVLAVLVLLAAVLVVRMVLVAGDDPPVAIGNDPTTAGATFASEGAKSAGLSAATRAAETILSYRHDRLDDDMAAARRLLGGSMLDEYDETMAAISEDTVRKKAVVEATVVAASAISATEHDVRALLFVNTTTEGKHLDQPRIDLNRVVVSLHRDAGDWVVTELDAL